MTEVSSEFLDTPLGDTRLTKRAVGIADRLGTAPDQSFPSLFDDGELEGLYRFVNNERVEPDLLLEPHYRATARRAADVETVIVAHDTTGFSFGGEVRRQGLGRIKTGGQGFYGHAALAIDGQSGTALGVLGMLPVFREGPPVAKKDRRKQHEDVREFERWETLVDLSCERLGRRAVHVMDREGDAYSVFCRLSDRSQDFVIRSKDDRVLDVPRGDREQPRHLHEAVDCAEHMFEREVDLSTKRPDRMARLRKQIGRMMRTAKLSVEVTSVAIRHPPYVAGKSRRGSSLPRAVPVNVVHIYETEAPKGQQPIDWLLLTNLPIDTPTQVAFIIDSYRRRWLIEEYFKALKTGCAYEKRQLESKHALLNALALFIPIAWRLLCLRSLARDAPNSPATTILSERQLMILRERAKSPLKRKPTIHEAMMAIASEGGHIKNNGDPGWQVLGRGYEKLLYMELGYVLAMAKGTR